MTVSRPPGIIPKRRPTPVAAIDPAVAPPIQVKPTPTAPLRPAGARAAAPAPLTVGRAPAQRTPIPLRTRSDQAARAQLDHTPLPEQRELEITPPPQLKRAPTGPQPTLGYAPPPQMKRAPTGPQSTLGYAPAPQMKRAPTGPQPTLGDAPPQMERAPSGLSPRSRTRPAPDGARAPPAHAVRPRPRPGSRSWSLPSSIARPAPRPGSRRAVPGASLTHARTVNSSASGPQTVATTSTTSSRTSRARPIYKREARNLRRSDHPPGRAPARLRSRKSDRALPRKTSQRNITQR